jgi:2-polyprenyl-3-methyl-5-hydroxy-6-metoxy-1,4-benzoquinol methylase
MSQPQTVLEEILKRAASFQQRHSQENGIWPTFSYFTYHPVAPLNKKRLRILLESLTRRAKELGRPLVILDLACGGGLITCAAAALGHKALGLDRNPEEIELAKLFALEEKFECSFLTLDLVADPEWEETAQKHLGGKPDVVILAYALHHLLKVEKLVDRLGHWLNPGSQLLINEENPKSPLFRLKHVIRTWVQKDTETEWHRTSDGWARMLTERGFYIASPIRGADLFPGLGSVVPKWCWSVVFTFQKPDSGHNGRPVRS